MAFAFSESIRDEIWRRWKNGESLSQIGRCIGKHAGSVFCFLQARGGIAPKNRKRSSRALTFSQREEISRGLAANLSFRKIAQMIQRAPSTVSREVARNGERKRYRASLAEKMAWKRARRPQLCLLAKNPHLNKLVSEKLFLDWSPEQISGWLKRTFPQSKDRRVSHETIYKSIYIPARGGLKKKHQRHLRTKRVMRAARKATNKGQPRGQIIDGRSIRERPKSIETRARFGHWEGDLISGSRNTHLATLVERRSRFTLILKLQGKDTDSVISAITAALMRLPPSLRKTLTWDRGMELAKHKYLSAKTQVDVYFCDPRSPWQRGTNENTNRLIRQYLPRRTDLGNHSQEFLDQIAEQLNCRPRKVLGFRSPRDKLDHLLH